MRQFIRQNRNEIDQCIRNVVPNIGGINDDEREMWINNDEGLYRWARRSGCRI
jgi:hypothetical protein